MRPAITSRRRTLPLTGYAHKTERTLPSWRRGSDRRLSPQMRFRGLIFRCVAAVTVAFAALLSLSYRPNQGTSVYPKSSGNRAETPVSSAGGDGKMELQIRRRGSSASDDGYRGDGEDESENYEYIYRGPEMFANETMAANDSNMNDNDEEYYNSDKGEADNDGDGDEGDNGD
eukprot:CAMPEP_0194268292 /NCGR_PEP_ID=MMETSP0169-20130528/2650_1 /TAXON_ID=218684 /ORGANISM="Corethron pennatum, Strain L29A3" /LENGTH=172 /DNA_ID=CAMNT_0039009477 /DNA_START=47 /DNA_END=562 /DNA_ORIENTATION=-